MGAADVVEAARIDYPGASVKFLRETCPVGPYTLVYVEGVSPEQAAECCDGLWRHARANIIGGFAVLVLDTARQYWGIDRSHYDEPKATYESKGQSKGYYPDREDPLMAALLESGTAIVRESEIFIVHPAPPWGPSRRRFPVGGV